MLIQHEILTPLVPRLIGLIIFLFGVRLAVRGLMYDKYVEEINARIDAALPQRQWVLIAKYAVGFSGVVGLVFYSPTNNLVISLALFYCVLIGAVAWFTRNHIPTAKIPVGMATVGFGFLVGAFLICIMGMMFMVSPAEELTLLE